jgi:DNA-damage-inducible protein J
MAATAFVRARISEKLKNDAADVLAGLGLTVSDLVRITLTRVANDKALPFDLSIPNAVTRAAIAESREIMQKKSLRFSNGKELIDALEKEPG